MSKPRVKTQADAYYREALRACSARLSPRVWDHDAEPIDLCTRLDNLLKSGWTIEALRSYASKWRTSRQPRVSPAVWRYGVYFASIDICGEGTQFLDEWKARQEDQTKTQAQAVSALSA